MKKLISLILALTMMLPLAGAISANNAYWPAQAAYNQAKAANDDAALVKAVDMIVDVYKNENSETAHNRMRTPLHEAALAYERMGMYKEAGKAYQMADASAKWLHDNTTDAAIKAANNEFRKLYARSMRYFNTEPEVYVASTQSAPFFGELNEPTGGTFAGMCDVYMEGMQSAMLLYAGYNRESFSSFEYYLPDTERTYYLEAAWNVVEENEAALDNISGGATDSYMIKELKYLQSYTEANPNCKILLRFGAEVNCWSPLNACGSDEVKIKAFADKYIKAFRYVADKARKYAPDVALIYSPVDYGHWYTTPETFYPGDDYVDFVGMSTYYNLNAADENKVGSKSDIIWGRGLYQDPVIRVAEIMECAEKHKKPVIVSECGFSYASSDGVQTEAHARDKLVEFYTYINMVYPQIKIVNLFNNNFSTNSYRIYANPIHDKADTISAMLREAYNSAVQANEAMASTFTGSTLQSYVKLDELNAADNKLKLYTYVPYPNPNANDVVYTLNGKQIAWLNKKPYSTEIDVSSLNQGVNTLSVRISAGKTVVNKDYILVRDGNTVDARLTNMTDVKGNEAWASDIGRAMAKGYINGTSATTVSPSANTTRAQLVTILYRSVGSPEISVANKFTDLKADWYKSAVLWASDNGIVNGTSATTYAPDNNVTVQDMAVILYRYYQNYLGKTPVKGSLDGVADASAIAGYAKDALAWAYSLKLVETKDGKLNPTSQATRAQVAKALVVLADMK
ncbi:MAG: S-layer homology domain-containing protein [Clostridia bacterium]|nr:S-layer homology domain-containing protein [Clostridia bacterium]